LTSSLQTRLPYLATRLRNTDEEVLRRLPVAVSFQLASLRQSTLIRDSLRSLTRVVVAPDEEGLPAVELQQNHNRRISAANSLFIRLAEDVMSQH